MRNHRLQVLVSEVLYHRLREAAGRSHVAVAAWVREAIEERLDREGFVSPEEALAALRKLEGPTADIDDMIAEIGSGRFPDARA
ncbi:hypothetical protein [Candidatus Palauibacter sp.]|uniref:hypothetical protein n=1 Tax=Candidatus Palauibacter sp. TaxID=3101350 RepID=UPI003B018B0E